MVLYRVPAEGRVTDNPAHYRGATCHGCGATGIQHWTMSYTCHNLNEFCSVACMEALEVEAALDE